MSQASLVSLAIVRLADVRSGFNITAAVQTHRGTIPTLPKLGEAMSKIAVEVPLPKVSAPRLPGDDNGEQGDDGQPHFIQNATVLSTFLDAVYLAGH